jgi:hypothetical protein
MDDCLQGGVIMKLWETFEYPGWPEGEPITDQLIRENIRFRRTPLLAACDWTQLPDAPLTSEQRQAWSDYRQALRDLPQVSDPKSIAGWPEPPTI